jgi:hypothetical protein
MSDKNCAEIWDQADYFPVDDAIIMWCDGSPSCMEARKNALLSALDRGEVKYRRRDNKDFQDSLYDLYSRKLILVERESFLVWAKSVSDAVEAQTLQNTAAINLRSETTYLNIIGSMLELFFDKSPGGQPYSAFASQSDIIQKILLNNPTKPGISQRTLEDKFAKAKKELASSP